MSLLKTLKYLSLAEGTTLLLLLLVAIPLKYCFNYPIATKIFGSIHGLVFLAYMGVLYKTIILKYWNKNQIAQLFMLAFIPLGGFINEKLIKKMMDIRL